MQWVKELDLFLPQTAHFLLSGNIYDSFLFEGIPLGLIDFLGRHLTEKNGYDQVVLYTPLSGFFHVSGNRKPFEEIAGSLDKEKKESLEKAYETISKITRNQKYHIAFIVNFASRMEEIAKSDFGIFIYKMFKDAVKAKKVKTENGIKHNLVIYLLDKEGDFPAWFYVEKPNVKSILIQKPDIKTRRQVIKKLLEIFQKQDDEKLISEITDRTYGMLSREIISIFQIAKQNNIQPENISQAIRTYKTGVKESPWESIEKSKVKSINSLIQERVKGQEEAIKKTSQIIRRAFFNLSGAQFSRYSQRPKGVLFLAGPTGVGKTELAKSIAEIVFGSEDALIRFDMSEFRHDHSDQRLLGAPPGYVGYESGGELINKIRENPFSVVLFDEIEKAHPRIMDIMLQLLDEGVLTSGRGEKAYFSECIVIFTSNLGASKVNPTMDFNRVEKTIKEEIENYFKSIQRPEILNRIGKNVVAFDFIREKEGRQIAEKMINNVIQKLKKERGITVEVENIEELLKASIRDLSMGGRGIGNTIEEIFINPLSELLFELDAKTGEAVKIRFGEELKGEKVENSQGALSG